MGGSRGSVFVVLLVIIVALAVAASIFGANKNHPAARPLAAATNPAGRTTLPGGETAGRQNGKEVVTPPIGALALGGQLGHAFLARSDETAADGAWTVVVRRMDGSLGRHGAVVTYPAASDYRGAGTPVRVGRVTGISHPGFIVWPIGNGHARVRGDLPFADLLRIAERTVVVAGRPQLTPPEELRVVAVAPSRPPLIHEIRYASDWLGVRVAPGGGLTYTALTTGGGFEDALYAAGAAAAGSVHGMPAVVSPVEGGNGNLAWEAAPGVVAYVGWSGVEMGPRVIAALRGLADNTYLMTPGQWLAAHPDLTEQENHPAD